GFIKRIERAVGVFSDGSHLGDGAETTDRGNVVTDGATRAVVRRSKTLLCRLDLEEVFEAEPELAKVGGRDAGQRIAGTRRGNLGIEKDDGVDPQERRREDPSRPSRGQRTANTHGSPPGGVPRQQPNYLVTTIVPRM